MKRITVMRKPELSCWCATYRNKIDLPYEGSFLFMPWEHAHGWAADEQTWLPLKVIFSHTVSIQCLNSCHSL